MTNTARFGLTLDAVLTEHDKQVLDTLLAAFETHDHKGGDKLLDPTTMPTGVLTPVGGHLPAGQSFHYRVSYLDKFGLETGASPELTVTTPLGLAPPVAPVVTTVAGGTLPTGPTAYALSVRDANGAETNLSDATLVTIADFLTARITAPDLDMNAATVSVWRRGPRHTGYFTRIATGLDPVTGFPFLDDGTVLDAESAEPTGATATLTNATSKVLLTVPDPVEVGMDPSKVKGWRLYRSLQSGVYGVNSLVVEQRSTVNPDGTGGLLTTFLDDGTVVLAAGAPLFQSQTLKPSVKIVGGGGGGAVLLATSVGNRRIVTSSDGSLITRASGGLVDPTAGATYLLSDPSKIAWRLGIASDGGLTTTQGTPAESDTAYLPGSGPLLPSPDPTISYVLGVTDDGSLTTTEV